MINFKVGEMLIDKSKRSVIVLEVDGGPYADDKDNGKNKWMKVLLEDGRDVWISRSYFKDFVSI